MAMPHLLHSTCYIVYLAVYFVTMITELGHNQLVSGQLIARLTAEPASLFAHAARIIQMSLFAGF